MSGRNVTKVPRSTGSTKGRVPVLTGTLPGSKPKKSSPKARSNPTTIGTRG